MASENPKKLSRVTAAEEDQISRVLLVWLNQYPNKPVNLINFEYLKADEPSMAMSLIQGAYKTRQYITGGYEAECQFKVIYRLQATDNNSRLTADEVLNNFADWAVAREDKPIFGANIQFRRLVSNTRSALFGRYENGDEDHQILMTLTYEVI